MKKKGSQDIKASPSMSTLVSDALRARRTAEAVTIEDATWAATETEDGDSGNAPERDPEDADRATDLEDGECMLVIHP